MLARTIFLRKKLFRPFDDFYLFGVRKLPLPITAVKLLHGLAKRTAMQVEGNLR